VLLPHGQRPVGFRGLTATSLTPRSASRARVAQTTPKSQANASGTVVSWPSVVLSVSLGTFEVNVVAPAGMVRGNAYAATKAALEAHTVNLAGTGVTGVTVNAYRPGGVDTAMQTWIRGQDYGRIGAGLHGRFNKNFADGVLITPEHSAAAPRTPLAVVARPATATASGRGIRIYLTAMTSTGLMEGSLASSLSAALPSASASGPVMCAWRPFSLAKVSKIP
jgi:NAD(P)-dependent dehydrogenase (short-subunit alcohol dehydrogenase family)